MSRIWVKLKDPQLQDTTWLTHSYTIKTTILIWKPRIDQLNLSGNLEILLKWTQVQLTSRTQHLSIQARLSLEKQLLKTALPSIILIPAKVLEIHLKNLELIVHHTTNLTRPRNRSTNLTRAQWETLTQIKLITETTHLVRQLTKVHVSSQPIFTTIQATKNLQNKVNTVPQVEGFQTIKLKSLGRWANRTQKSSQICPKTTINTSVQRESLVRVQIWWICRPQTGQSKFKWTKIQISFQIKKTGVRVQNLFQVHQLTIFKLKSHPTNSHEVQRVKSAELPHKTNNKRPMFKLNLWKTTF